MRVPGNKKEACWGKSSVFHEACSRCQKLMREPWIRDSRGSQQNTPTSGNKSLAPFVHFEITDSDDVNEILKTVALVHNL